MAVKEISNREKYINPYNFISLDTINGCTKMDMQKQENEEKNNLDFIQEEQKLTGYIECTLNTKTPLVIPDIKSRVEEKIGNDIHPKYSFFNYEEKMDNTNVLKPVIPGSEIRGMLRNDFEVLTNSCMSSVNTEKSMIARTTGVKLPGLIKKDAAGNWHLYKAQRVPIKTTRQKNIAQSNPLIFYKNDNNEITINGINVKTGNKVYFSCKTINNTKILISISTKRENANTNCGYIFIGEDFGNRKRADSIFVIGNEEIKGLDNLDSSVDALQEILEMYNDSAFNKNMGNRKKWYPGYSFNSSNEDGYIPVWYSVLQNTKKIYLSLAAIGKEAYFRKLNDLINVGESSYTPCIDKKQICEACYLFGYVSNNEAIGSKIRISDAEYQGTENPYLKERVLQELSTPRISNTTFYSLYLTNKDLILLNKDEKSFVDWNYDYKYSRNDKGVLLSNDEIKIRGRKAYWHHIPKNENAVKTGRNCTVIPVKENSEFKFKVYFENISEEHLKHLISTLSLNYETNENKDYYDLCHKIGRGKPLGYGSVKIAVDNVFVKELLVKDNKIQYNLISKDEYKNTTINEGILDENSETFKDIIKIYNFNYIKENYGESIVNYPVGITKTGKSEGYSWFLVNRSSKLNNPHVYMVLPKISEGGDKKINEERLTGIIKENKEEVLKIDGLNIPVLQELNNNPNFNNNNNNKNNKHRNNNNFNHQKNNNFGKNKH